MFHNRKSQMLKVRLPLERKEEVPWHLSWRNQFRRKRDAKWDLNWAPWIKDMLNLEEVGKYQNIKRLTMLRSNQDSDIRRIAKIRRSTVEEINSLCWKDRLKRTVAGWTRLKRLMRCIRHLINPGIERNSIHIRPQARSPANIMGRSKSQGPWTTQLTCQVVATNQSKQE